ncbi:hypothetical protein J2S43_007199 [Catenuloplanes nepalensis]|uniref:Methylamine utilisation protein MauE domain-containing protein n=1 Tax=Catenuloplanes nepalensis TaxID=587533 RepID=A0ABT9N4P8_9ACTN|nr:MauE/DoxX family redox-associated membrane protein [Catenuloplanes nepalensis]MDP9798687.1 hypothetical protein [Catenuloplanes nepalensis]
MAYLEVFTRGLIGLVFLLSAWSKMPIGDRFGEFAASLAGMRLLPGRFARPAATLVVAAEAVTPVLLLTIPVLGFALAAALLLGFTVSIVTVLRRGTRATCRCFGGSAPARFRWHHVARNVALLVVTATGTAAVSAQPSVPWQVAAVGSAAGLAVALLVAHLDDLVGLFAPIPAGDL